MLYMTGSRLILLQEGEQLAFDSSSYPPYSGSVFGGGLTASAYLMSEFETAMKAGLPHSSSATVGFVELDANDSTSFIISGSGTNLLYMTGSGNRIGFNTTDPQKSLDFRADEMQFQKKTEQKGMRINSDGDLESYNFDAASSATGSELIMTYQAGGTTTVTGSDIFNVTRLLSTAEWDAQIVAEGLDNVLATLSDDANAEILYFIERTRGFNIASAGDVLGSIRWIAQSGSGLDDRVAGEAAVISAVVSDSDDTGVQADLIFKVAGKTGAASQKLILDAGNVHELTGSLNLSGNVVVGVNTTTAGTVTAEHLTSTDDATITDTLTVGTIANVNTTHVTASGNISASGNIYSANEEHIQFTFQTEQDSDANWRGPNRQGIENYYWNKDHGNDTGVLTLDWSSGANERFLNTGYRVPYKMSICKVFVYSIGNNNSSVRAMSSSLLIGNPETESPGASSITLEQKCLMTSNEAESRYAQMTASQEFAPGDFIVSESQWLYPRIKPNVSGNDLLGTFSIIYKRIP